MSFHKSGGIEIKRKNMKEPKTTPNKRRFQKLMRLIRENPNVGLEKFYNTYGKIIQITARTICRSFEQADEVINTVLVKVWQLSQREIPVENPEGWVYVLTANAAKDRLKERTFLPLHDTIAAKNDKIEQLLSHDAFYSMIDVLTEEEKALMIDKFIKKLTFREIAGENGKNINAVSAVYYRAIEKVKKYLEEQNGD